MASALSTAKASRQEMAERLERAEVRATETRRDRDALRHRLSRQSRVLKMAKTKVARAVRAAAAAARRAAAAEAEAAETRATTDESVSDMRRRCGLAQGREAVAVAMSIAMAVVSRAAVATATVAAEAAVHEATQT
eukprot:3518204-Pleurochrysis_carterae.AAC.1